MDHFLRSSCFCSRSGKVVPTDRTGIRPLVFMVEKLLGKKQQLFHVGPKRTKALGGPSAPRLAHRYLTEPRNLPANRQIARDQVSTSEIYLHDVPQRSHLFFKFIKSAVNDSNSKSKTGMSPVDGLFDGCHCFLAETHVRSFTSFYFGRQASYVNIVIPIIG